MSRKEEAALSRERENQYAQKVNALLLKKQMPKLEGKSASEIVKEARQKVICHIENAKVAQSKEEQKLLQRANECASESTKAATPEERELADTEEKAASENAPEMADGQKILKRRSLAEKLAAPQEYSSRHCTSSLPPRAPAKMPQRAKRNNQVPKKGKGSLIRERGPEQVQKLKAIWLEKQKPKPEGKSASKLAKETRQRAVCDIANAKGAQMQSSSCSKEDTNLDYYSLLLLVTQAEPNESASDDGSETVDNKVGLKRTFTDIGSPSFNCKETSKACKRSKK